MEKKVAILKTDKTTNKKEIFYIVLESIFDIRRKNTSNLYAFKTLMELERIAKYDETIAYEFKLIGEDDLETYLSNCAINDKQVAPQGTFFSFLIYYSRILDEFINDTPSRIIMSNNNLKTLIEWTKKSIKKQQDSQTNINQINKGK